MKTPSAPPTPAELLHETDAHMVKALTIQDASARASPRITVAWVGMRGDLLFCDPEGKQRFSFDCERLAAEIRADRASIPEHSLTRKAFLRVKSSLESTPD